MPYISTHITTPLSKNAEISLKEKLGKAIALLPGKSERWLMVEFQDNCRLYFQGKNDAPVAFVEVKAVGAIAPEASEKLTAAICDMLEEELSISPDHVYIKYESTDLWGWNGVNF